jgi:membrane-bound lytic murein transglycosylase B
MTRLAAALLGAALAAAAPVRAAPPAPYATRPEVHAFVRDLVERHGFVERELVFLFKRARRDAAVLRAIAAAADPRARSWRDYRARFVNRARIGDGLEFRRREAAALERAAREHGVPEEILVAIIGVESLYGRQMGAYRVVDALATLAFDHPARAEFFRSELEQYLLYARDAQIDVFSVRGSYAGAIGIPQFMPGSVRRYAVDFDGDGRIELRASASDAIGSVANFLAKHGWRRGEAIALPAHVNGSAHRAMLEAGIEPRFRLQDLKQYGVEARTGLALETAVALIELDTPGAAPEYRLGLRNFWVLTRYNRSSFYAAAVIDLAGALRAERHGRYDGGR